MTKKLLFNTVIFVLLVNIFAYAADFSFSALIINSGNKKYKAVKITPAIYNNTNANLSDLSISDKDNDNVPYFINSFNANSSENNIDNFIDILSPSFTIEEKGETTIVRIESLKNLRLDSVTIDTDSTFKRIVSLKGKSKMLYNLDLQNTTNTATPTASTTYKDTTLSLNSYKILTDSVELSIDNQDDKPIIINKIVVKYYVDELLFDGSKGGNFTLKFGNNEIKLAPNYDIANYKDLVLKEGYDVLNIKDIKQAQESPQVPLYDYRWIFNIVIIVVTIILGIIVFLRLRRS